MAQATYAEQLRELNRIDDRTHAANETAEFKKRHPEWTTHVGMVNLNDVQSDFGALNCGGLTVMDFDKAHSANEPTHKRVAAGFSSESVGAWVGLGVVGSILAAIGVWHFVASLWDVIDGVLK